jgi:hypothetical protein
VKNLGRTIEVGYIEQNYWEEAVYCKMTEMWRVPSVVIVTSVLLQIIFVCTTDGFSNLNPETHKMTKYHKQISKKRRKLLHLYIGTYIQDEHKITLYFQNDTKSKCGTRTPVDKETLRVWF